MLNNTVGLMVGIISVGGFAVGIGAFLWKLHDRIRDLERKMERYDKYFDAFEATVARLIGTKMAGEK